MNKRKIRAKDSVNTVWWLSKGDYPKADIRRVLVSYSDRMKKLHQNPDKYYTPKVRPSGHDIGTGFLSWAEQNKQFDRFTGWLDELVLTRADPVAPNTTKTPDCPRAHRWANRLNRVQTRVYVVVSNLVVRTGHVHAQRGR